MHGSEVGTVVSALQGCTREHVALGHLLAQLHLSRGANMSIEGNFSITRPAGVCTRYSRPPGAAQALADRLGLNMAVAVAAEPGGLTLQFTHGSTLNVDDSSEHPESLRMSLGDRFIVA